MNSPAPGSAPETPDCLVITCNSRGHSLTLLLLDGETGQLTELETLPFPGVTGGVGASPMAVSPNRRYLYLAFRGKPPAVLSFAIDLTRRKLDFLGQAGIADNMAYIATDRTGTFLFGASYGGGIVTLNPIGPNGVAQETLEVIDTGPKAHCVVPSPDNTLVLGPNISKDAVLRFRFDATTGEFSQTETPAVRVAKGSGPRHLVLHPSNRFAYVVNELEGTVDAFSFDPVSGDMALLQSSTIVPQEAQVQPAAADIHLTPDGRFLYASERASNTLSSFAVDARTGFLSFIGFEATAKSPRGFNIDPSGRYLLQAGETEDQLISYGIDQVTGKLGRLQELTVKGGPNWVEILALP